MKNHSIRVAVDIGGTFTDLHLHDASKNLVFAYKTASTPADPSVGLITGLKQICELNGYRCSDISLILHGSTIATNAVLERKLPRAALLTTSGFRDVLEIGRHIRKDVYALSAEPRSLLIPRQYRFEVSERILANGSIETPLVNDDLLPVIEELRAQQIEALAIVFLHGYRNPLHEQQAAQFIQQHVPHIAVTTSYESSPEIREFERSSTTVLNAMLRPVISGYLDQVRNRLHDNGIAAPLYLVQSNGGLATPEDAALLPAKLLLSGPAGGAMAMSALAKAHGIGNLIGFDMGGTSTDISVVIDSEVGETTESAIDGLPVRLPMVEIRTVGAGGGSLAKIDGGGLRVGPQSAGAEPGPVCYSRGGTQPAVTDANAVLCRLDPDSFLAGSMQIDHSAAGKAMQQHIGVPLQLDAGAAADGVVQVANVNMAAAVRLSLFEKGCDPHDFTLAPFGGAAGLHACAVASELGINDILFPASASTLSALGILHADLRYDLSESALMPARPESLLRLCSSIEKLCADAQTALDRSGVATEQGRVEISCDLRYRGQAFELNTPWHEVSATSAPGDTALAALIERFHQIHHSRFAYSAPDDPVEIVTLRATAIGELGQAVDESNFAFDSLTRIEGSELKRDVSLNGKWQQVDVFRRSDIIDRQWQIAGPALIEEAYTVLLIEEGWLLTPYSNGDLVCRRAG